MGESLDRMKSGRIEPPVPLSPAGRCLDRPPDPANIAPPLSVKQRDKVQAFDDLKRAATSRGALTDAPISIPSWDLIVGAGRSLRRRNHPTAWIRLIKLPRKKTPAITFGRELRYDCGIQSALRRWGPSAPVPNFLGPRRS